MRAFALLVLLASSLATVARAQNGQSEIVVPPAPPVMPEQPAQTSPPPPVMPPPPPGLVQTPLPAMVVPDQAQSPSLPTPDSGENPQQAQSAQSSPSPVPPPDVAPAPPNQWVLAHAALLGVLNKIDGSISQISVPVGGQANIGALQVSVQACASRPGDELPDAAAFLTVQATDGDSAAQLYKGWMVRSIPGAAIVGNAAEIFRIINCS